MLLRMARSGKLGRVCDITGMVEPWLREAFEASQTGHIIERNGKPVRDIHTEFRALCQSLDLVNFRFHDLRSTWAAGQHWTAFLWNRSAMR